MTTATLQAAQVEAPAAMAVVQEAIAVAEQEAMAAVQEAMAAVQEAMAAAQEAMAVVHITTMMTTAEALRVTWRQLHTLANMRTSSVSLF